EHPAEPGQGVLIQPPGLLVRTQRPQLGGEVAGRTERVGVIVAQRAIPGNGGMTVGSRLPGWLRHADFVVVQRKDAEPRYEGGPSEINFIGVLRCPPVSHTPPRSACARTPSFSSRRCCTLYGCAAVPAPSPACWASSRWLSWSS